MTRKRIPAARIASSESEPASSMLDNKRSSARSLLLHAMGMKQAGPLTPFVLQIHAQNKVLSSSRSGSKDLSLAEAPGDHRSAFSACIYGALLCLRHSSGKHVFATSEGGLELRRPPIGGHGTPFSLDPAKDGTVRFIAHLDDGQNGEVSEGRKVCLGVDGAHFCMRSI